MISNNQRAYLGQPKRALFCFWQCAVLSKLKCKTMQTQKITGIAAILFLSAFAMSCSDDEEVMNEDQLVGSWSLESQEIKNIIATVPGVPLPLPVSQFLPEEYQEVLDTLGIFPKNAILTFEQDKKYTVSDPSTGDNALTGTWVLSEDGEQLTITGLDQVSQLLNTNSLVFAIQNFTASNLSLLASVSDISLTQFNISELEGATVSGEYQLDLKK